MALWQEQGTAQNTGWPNVWVAHGQPCACKVEYTEVKTFLAIDHIQVTVKDMKTAEPFYDKLMPILGFDIQHKVRAIIEEHDLFVVEYLHPQYDFGICSPRTAFADHTIHRRKPGSLHHRKYFLYAWKTAELLFIQGIGICRARALYAQQGGLSCRRNPFFWAVPRKTSGA